MSDLHLKHKLKGLREGRVLYFKELDSTNSYLKKYYQKLPKNTLVLTDVQTGGYGRKGRSWVSENADNLYFSFLLDVSFFKGDVLNITQLLSLAIADTIQEGFGLDIKIKWPNDLYYQGKKLCGILCELVGDGENLFVVAGVGLNVNDAPDIKESYEAICLKTILGKELDKQNILNDISDSLTNYLYLFEKQGFDSFFKDYCSFVDLNTIEQTIKVSGDSITGKIIGIERDGSLLFELTDGTQQKIFSADLEF